MYVPLQTRFDIIWICHIRANVNHFISSIKEGKTKKEMNWWAQMSAFSAHFLNTEPLLTPNGETFEIHKKVHSSFILADLNQLVKKYLWQLKITDYSHIHRQEVTNMQYFWGDKFALQPSSTLRFQNAGFVSYVVTNPLPVFSSASCKCFPISLHVHQRIIA